MPSIGETALENITLGHEFMNQSFTISVKMAAEGQKEVGISGRLANACVGNIEPEGSRPLLAKNVSERPSIPRRGAEFLQLKEDLADTRRELSESRSESAGTRKELSESRKELIETRKELVETRKELVECRKELINSRTGWAGTRSELEETRRELEDTRATLAEARSEAAKNSQSFFQRLTRSPTASEIRERGQRKRAAEEEELKCLREMKDIEKKREEVFEKEKEMARERKRKERNEKEKRLEVEMMRRMKEKKEREEEIAKEKEMKDKAKPREERKKKEGNRS